MKPSIPKHGGAGRGQGRKSIKEGEATVTVAVKMAESQREKLKRLGGSKWVRDRIDKSKEPE